MTPTARYGAFISYSHAASAEVARGLEKWLQIYAKPWWRWRAVKVFRDENDLTAAGGYKQEQHPGAFARGAVRCSCGMLSPDPWAELPPE